MMLMKTNAINTNIDVDVIKAHLNNDSDVRASCLWEGSVKVKVKVREHEAAVARCSDDQTNRTHPNLLNMDEGQSDESQNRPEKKPHAEPDDEDHAEKICDKDEGFKNVEEKPSIFSGQTFVVVLAGKTNEAHRDFVKKLEAVGQTEVSSPEGCDYVVCFCPVASRVGTDVSEALDRIPADKPSILVVMHHTFSPDHVVAESRRLVIKSNVHLTLDCLFHEGQFLKCERNDAAWDEVKKKLGVYDNQERFSSSSPLNLLGSVKNKTSTSRASKKFYALITKTTTAPKRCFYVSLAGKTNGAHRDFVKKLEAVGQTEAKSPEGCDYVVCFCPVASRVGTDVSEALDRIPADKPCILVVMHHTFNPDHVVAESRRLVTKSNVHLTLDCLFYERHFLKCKRNDAAWDLQTLKKAVEDMCSSKSATDQAPTPETATDQAPASVSVPNHAPVPQSVSHQAPTSESATDQAPAPESVTDQTPAPESVTDQAPAQETATDQDPALKSATNQDRASESVTDQDQASESVTDQDPASDSATDQAPALKSVTNQDPALKSVTDQDPALKSATDQDPALKSATDQDPALKSTTDQDPAPESVTDRATLLI